METQVEAEAHEAFSGSSLRKLCLPVPMMHSHSARLLSATGSEPGWSWTISPDRHQRPDQSQTDPEDPQEMDALLRNHLALTRQASLSRTAQSSTRPAAVAVPVEAPSGISMVFVPRPPRYHCDDSLPKVAERKKSLFIGLVWL